MKNKWKKLCLNENVNEVMTVCGGDAGGQCHMKSDICGYHFG